MINCKYFCWFKKEIIDDSRYLEIIIAWEAWWYANKNPQVFMLTWHWAGNSPEMPCSVCGTYFAFSRGVSHVKGNHAIKKKKSKKKKRPPSILSVCTNRVLWIQMGLSNAPDFMGDLDANVANQPHETLPCCAGKSCWGKGRFLSRGRYRCLQSWSDA